MATPHNPAVGLKRQADGTNITPQPTTTGHSQPPESRMCVSHTETMSLKRRSIAVATSLRCVAQLACGAPSITTGGPAFGSTDAH